MKEFQDFMESKENYVHEFQNAKWMCDFVGINGHLNYLNRFLQGKDQLIYTFYDSISYVTGLMGKSTESQWLVSLSKFTGSKSKWRA
jgi:hypothetical protein